MSTENGELVADEAPYCPRCDDGCGCEEHGREPTAAGLLYKRFPHNNGDRPSVSVWMPESVPWAVCQVHSHGCDQPDTLPQGPVVVNLNLGGIRFGGYLSDLELQLAAAQEALAFARAHAERLGAVIATEGYHEGRLVRAQIDGSFPLEHKEQQ